MYKVLLTDNLTQEVLNVFTHYPDLRAVRTATLPRDELVALLPDYHAVIVRSPTKLSGEVLAHGKNLKFIGRAGAGCDNIDIDEATRRGIVVMNVPFGNTISTAEHTFALLLALVRHVPGAHQSVTSGAWDRKAFRGTELFGKTLGIIGLGRVGSEVARRALAFSMTVLAADPFIEAAKAAALGIELTNMEALLQASDIVTIHVPLDDSTRKMISHKEIAAMRDGAYLINCARGGVVDEAAVADACRGGKLAGVACDVYSAEPPVGNPILTLPNAVLSPHIGGATTEAQIRVAVEISVKVADALVNGIITDAVNHPGCG
ncbi:MAG: hydroxyacid dehydrogenase [Candidatus Latescibacterota bacterium]